ncbi:hypothetical protein MesoLjLc_71100 [Mesorhizobium sp. L-8-10]|uniref:hypothetical protein n=1 Tax=Mesorhizobium sp. L-8-10 TaxID=2744523 RepID=UPI001927B6B7|nr:hypothetical protein [Mesorhizobium sp. L-8-10]BCH35180.1 hypothetical protein MesoLjLc_71100 [Mesorhizobium sp. L-8-10]
MFTRTAFFEGHILEGMEEAFFVAVESHLLPIWRRLPHAQKVRLFWPVTCDEDTPAVFLIQQIDYPSLAAIEEAMASPVREEARLAHQSIMSMYEGRHYHLVCRRQEADC